jgi:hypothetical protein
MSIVLPGVDPEAGKRIRGCTICGLPKTLHFYKSHPYGAQYKAASYKLDSLGINTDAVVGLEDTFIDMVQSEGREMFKNGMLIEEPGREVRLKLRPHDGDYRRDVDLGDSRSSGHPPGRAIIEQFAGRGLVGDNPDPAKRIYIVQNADWPSVFAHVVALSSFARARQPALRVGQRAIIERSMTDRIAFRTPSSGDSLARFQVIHVDDIYAIA